MAIIRRASKGWRKGFAFNKMDCHGGLASGGQSGEKQMHPGHSPSQDLWLWGILPVLCSWERDATSKSSSPAKKKVFLTLRCPVVRLPCLLISLLKKTSQKTRRFVWNFSWKCQSWPKRDEKKECDSLAVCVRVGVWLCLYTYLTFEEMKLLATIHMGYYSLTL